MNKQCSKAITNLFYFASLLLLLAGCDKHDDEFQLNNGINLSDIIRFEKVTTDNIEADNQAYATVTIRISPYADTIGRDVIFVAQGATFSNNDTAISVKANSEGLATALVKSDSINTARIRATIGRYYTVDTTVHFIRAYPHNLLFSADKYVTDTAGSFSFTAQLFRDPGKGSSSDPAAVYFQVVSKDTSLNLIAPEFAYTNNATATITVSNPFKISGNFEITAKTLRNATDTLTKKIQFQIRKP